MVARYLPFESQASFKRQLMSYFIVSVIILAIVTSVITAWQTSLKIRQSTIENAMQITSNFADQTVLSLLTESEENGLEAVKRAEGFHSVSGVVVLKSNGELLIASELMSEKDFFVDKADFSDSTQLLKEFDKSWIFSAPVFLVDDEFDSETVDPNEEVLQKQIIGFVIVEYNKNELYQIQSSIFINNIVTGSLIAFILSVLMNLGINRLTQPLSELSETMRLAKDLSSYPKATIVGAAEIRQMAEVYNQMMFHLEQQKLELEKNRDTLESEVGIRTQELKAARDSALTANRHKSEFLANISHELRTPLQAIIGYTDLVREDLELECMDAQVEDLNKSIRSAHNLLALINNILDLAKIEAGRMDLYLKPVDMKSLLNETLETVQPMALANDNELLIKQGKLPEHLLLDRQKIMQIFLNLLSNACKFTKNGQVVFEIFNEQHFLYFSVTDTGEGIPQEKIEFIFEQFTQVDGSQTRKYEGTGLGMAITKTFCDLMKAKMTVKSQVGVGSTFTVKLPLKEN